jgi:hypothetical protein
MLDVRSFRAADCDTDHYLMVTKVRERLAMRKKTHRVQMKRFNLKKFLPFTNSLRQSEVISQLCQFVQSLYSIMTLVWATVMRYISSVLGRSPRPQIILFFVLERRAGLVYFACT